MHISRIAWRSLENWTILDKNSNNILRAVNIIFISSVN